MLKTAILFSVFAVFLADNVGMRPYELEDPMVHPRLCGMQNKGLLCDPKHILDGKQRQELLYALFSAQQNAQIFQDECPLDPINPRIFVVDRIVSNQVNESKRATAEEMQEFVQFLLKHQLSYKAAKSADFANCTTQFQNPVILYSQNDSKLIVGLNISMDDQSRQSNNKEVFFNNGESAEAAIEKALLMLVNEHRKNHNVPPLRSLFVPLAASKIRTGVWESKHKCLVSTKGAEVCDLGNFFTDKQHSALVEVFNQLMVNTSVQSDVECRAAPLKPYVYVVRKVPTVDGQDYNHDDMQQYLESFAESNPVDRCGKHVLILVSSEDHKYDSTAPLGFKPRAFHIKGGKNSLLDLNTIEIINRHNTRNIVHQNWTDALIYAANVLSREYRYKLEHGGKIVDITIEQPTAAPPTFMPKTANAVGDPTRNRDYEICGNDVASRLCDVDRFLSNQSRSVVSTWLQGFVDAKSSGGDCREQPILPYIYLLNKIPTSGALYATQAEMTKYARDVHANIDPKSRCGKEYVLVFSTATKDYGLATGENINKPAMTDIVQTAMKMFIDDGNWVSGLKYIAHEINDNFQLMWHPNN